MPGDVTGSLVYDPRSAEFSFRDGPVFTNLLLADEINRTPPKTQSALLEAMEERQVSVDGVTRPLPDPFLVAATQNPIEYEGTYPLPEAQLDRFLLKLRARCPRATTRSQVLTPARRRLRPARPRPRPASTRCSAPPSSPPRARRRRAVQRRAPTSSATSSTSRAPPASQPVAAARRLARAARPALLAASQAWAWLTGRDYVTPDHVKALAAAGAAAPGAAAARGRARGRHRGRGAATSIVQQVPVPR